MRLFPLNHFHRLFSYNSFQFKNMPRTLSTTKYVQLLADRVLSLYLGDVWLLTQMRRMWNVDVTRWRWRHRLRWWGPAVPLATTRVRRTTTTTSGRHPRRHRTSSPAGRKRKKIGRHPELAVGRRSLATATDDGEKNWGSNDTVWTSRSQIIKTTARTVIDPARSSTWRRWHRAPEAGVESPVWRERRRPAQRKRSRLEQRRRWRRRKSENRETAAADRIWSCCVACFHTCRPSRSIACCSAAPVTSSSASSNCSRFSSWSRASTPRRCPSEPTSLRRRQQRLQLLRTPVCRPIIISSSASWGPPPSIRWRSRFPPAQLEVQPRPAASHRRPEVHWICCRLRHRSTVWMPPWDRSAEDRAAPATTSDRELCRSGSRTRRPLCCRP